MAFSWLLNGAYKSWDDPPPVSKKIVAILLMLEIQLSPAEVGSKSPLFTPGFSTILSVVNAGFLVAINVVLCCYFLGKGGPVPSTLELPPTQDSSDHQDYYIFNRESQTKPSFEFIIHLIFYLVAHAYRWSISQSSGP